MRESNMFADTLKAVQELANAAAAFERAKATLETPPSRDPFNAVCERWWAWREHWREEGEAVKYGWQDLQPNAGDISSEYTTGDEVYFSAQDRDGDWMSNTIPVAYFADPDAWEAQAERSGEYRNVVEVLATQKAERERLAQAAAERQHAQMVETLRASGYEVTWKDVE